MVIGGQGVVIGGQGAVIGGSGCGYRGAGGGYRGARIFLCTKTLSSDCVPFIIRLCCTYGVVILGDGGWGMCGVWIA